MWSPRQQESRPAPRQGEWKASGLLPQEPATCAGVDFRPPTFDPSEKDIPAPSPRLYPLRHCPRAGRDRERTVRGGRIGWRVSRPPCRSSGRPDAPDGAEGRLKRHGRPRAARGRGSLRGAGVPARKRPELCSVDLDRGDKPPSFGRAGRSDPTGGQACGSGESPRGPPERGGNVRSRRRGESLATIIADDRWG